MHSLSIQPDSGDSTQCKVTPVMLHGVVGDTTPCRMTRVTLHGFVSPDMADRALSFNPHFLWAKGRNDGRTRRAAGYPLGAVHLLSIQPDLIVRQSVLRFPPVLRVRVWGLGFGVKGLKCRV